MTFTFNVRLTFQYPAWNEVDGLLYEDIRAATKADAIKYARDRAWRDGHLGGGAGRATFKAEKTTK